MCFISLPTGELFNIKMHYRMGVEKLVGFVDYCSADQISKIELLSMCKSLMLDVESCTIWWLDVI